MEIVEDPDKVEAAFAHQYDNLAREFASLLPTRGILAEIGCGRGQLTIPLATLFPRCIFEAVDTFKGAYAGTWSQLKLALVRARLKDRVRVRMTDYLDWISDEFSDKYAAVISSEFLPEIDSYELKMFLPECFRVLRHGGRTVHSFLSSNPRNHRQRLLIEADTNPIWTKTPPKEWFSPKPVLVASKLRGSRFRDVRVKRIKSNLIIRANAAKELLKTWDVRSSFWEKYESRLMRTGLEIPDWVIISGLKPSRGSVL